MAIAIQKYAQALCEAAEQPGVDTTQLVKDFMKLIRKHHRGNDVALIIREIIRYYDMNEEITERVQLEYAGGHNPEELLHECVGRLAHNKEVRIIAKKNPSLVGGARVIARGRLFDGTVAGALARFKNKLVK